MKYLASAVIGIFVVLFSASAFSAETKIIPRPTAFMSDVRDGIVSVVKDQTIKEKKEAVKKILTGIVNLPLHVVQAAFPGKGNSPTALDMEPREIISFVSEVIIAVLNSNASQKDKIAAIEAIVEQYVDIQSIGRKSYPFGGYKRLSSQQKADYDQTFREYFLKRGDLVPSFDQLTAMPPEIIGVVKKYDNENKEVISQEVKTKLKIKDKPEADVGFKFQSQNGRWVVYDFTIQDISHNGQNQTNFGQLRDNSFEGIMYFLKCCKDRGSIER